MTSLTLRAAFAVAFLALAGCASQPEIPFDHSAEAIKTIGVLTTDIPSRPTVRLASDIGQSFGLIGGLIDASMEAKRSDKLYGIMLDRKMNARVVFEQYLSSALRAHGYTVTTVPIQRVKNGYVPHYPSAADTKADAYIDVSFLGIGYGYVAASISSGSPYRPFVWLNCRLVRASDGSVLMQDTVLYNWINQGPAMKAVSLSADPAYSYTDFDALQANPAAAADGIDSALHKTADAVANLVR